MSSSSFGLDHQYGTKKAFSGNDLSGSTVKRDALGLIKRSKVRYKPGSCKNCGATTHKEIECVERPRGTKTKAVFTGVSLTTEERARSSFQKNVKVSFDAKRDRYRGYADDFYDSTSFQRKLEKAEKLSENETIPENPNNVVASQNLRIREDTAKYLLNLDPESAHYDPKTRSMNENPHENNDNGGKTRPEYKGEAYYKTTGEVKAFSEQQAFAAKLMRETGDTKFNPITSPTLVDQTMKNAAQEKSKQEQQRIATLLQKYNAETNG